MNRRDFLKTMIAAAAAPAIVKAENIMKVWVPPEKKIITGELGHYNDLFMVNSVHIYSRGDNPAYLLIDGVKTVGVPPNHGTMLNLYAPYMGKDFGIEGPKGSGVTIMGRDHTGTIIARHFES